MNKGICITAHSLAEQFVGLTEVQGNFDNPQIMSMLKLDANWPTHDEVPWCSAFVNYICWLLDLPRSKSLLARSWLKVGKAVTLEKATCGFCVCIFARKDSNGNISFDKENYTAAGHVGFYSDISDKGILLLGGNQNNSVNYRVYKEDTLLGIRKLL